MVKKIAFVSDFDGTISPEDFFWYVSNRYLDEKALAPWQRYLDGHESHLNALNQIFARIHVPLQEFEEFIKTIPYDKDFPKTAELCRLKNIPLYICSAGCEYYINLIIGEQIRTEKIKLVTNHGEYSQQNGLRMIPPAKNSPFYDEQVGISKAAVVQKLKDEGYFVVFAGDGPPDVAPAALADVVFAKKILAERCREQGIPYLKFDNFEDIYRYLTEV